MQFAALLQPGLRNQIRNAAEEVRAWEERTYLDPAAADALADRIRPFAHTTTPPSLRVLAADAGGAYPLLRYGGAAALFTVSAGAAFYAGADGRPHEEPVPPPQLDLCWLPADGEAAADAVEAAFARLGGEPLANVVGDSDYRTLKTGRAGAQRLLHGLIRPPATDASNLGLQLRRVAELGEALRLANSAQRGDWILTGGTMALPYVQRPDTSLYQEHLLRLVAIRARTRGALLATLTGSHGLPLARAAERIADARLAGGERSAEHWALRLPIPEVDDWACPFLSGTLLPPPGAVTYLVRLHAQEPVLRLDLDREAWLERVAPERPDAERRQRDLLEGLDFYAHDLRAYGRPYPLYAAAVRTHLGDGERAGLRRRLQDELAAAGARAGRTPVPSPQLR